MAGGLTAAMNKVSSTFEDIPKSFGQGLQSGTNIRVQNNQDKRAQSQSDFKKLKSLVEIQMPKLRKLDPEQRKVLIEKVKEENSEIVKRLGFETFTTAFTEQVSFELNIKATESTREDYYQRTGEEAPFKVGDPVTKTVTNDGGISYSNIGSSTNGEKDFSATNITTLFKTILSSQAWGEEDSDKAWKDTLKIIRTVNPNSDWLKPGALADVKDNSVGAPEDRLPPEEAKEKISLFTKLFRRFNDPNKAVAKAIPKQPKKIKPVSFDSFRDNPVKGVPVEFPNGQTKVWKGGSFSLRDSWKDG